MPGLKVAGKKINRVSAVKVVIDHGTAKEALQIPIMQFVVTIPADNIADLAEWALAPHGDKRWKDVEVETYDRSRQLNHTWTLKKAYVHSYKEVEFDEESGSETDQGTYRELTIRGTLIHANTKYDGKNVLEVKKGVTEK